MRVVIDAGSADDPPKRASLAHLCEHMMFEGTKHVPQEGFYAFLDRAGAVCTNAETHPLTTTPELRDCAGQPIESTKRADAVPSGGARAAP